MTGLSMIAAMTPERVIGRNNDLPWHLPSDLARFKKITTEIGTMVMGGNTFRSILARRGSPLPGRRHVVITRSDDLAARTDIATASSLEAAMTAAGERACVIGGEQVYRLFLPYVSKLFMTLIPERIEGDAYFPWNRHDWRLVSADGPKQHDARDQYPSTFITYDRA